MSLHGSDVLFSNATIIDGSGAKRYLGNVLVRDGHILSITHATSIEPGHEPVNRRVIDCESWVLSPGFIDMHAHSDLSLLHTPTHEAKITQGCTSEVVGQDGISYSPVNDKTMPRIRKQIAGWNGNPSNPPDFFDRWRSVQEYLDVLDREKIATNAAYLVPQGNLRILVKGWDSSPCSQEEVNLQKDILARSLEEGAVGMSSGLTYVPGMFADNEEVAQLCEVVKQYGGYYCPHHRSYGKGAIEAYKEMIVLAKQTGVRLHLTHATLNFEENAGRADELLRMIDEARANGVEISLDTYPYLPGSTTLASTLPSWAEAAEDKAAILNDPKQLERIKQGFTLSWDILEIAGVSDPSLAERYVGKTLAEIAKGQQREPFDVYVDVLKEDDFNSTILVHCGHEDNAASARVGTFPRYLGHYTRDLAQGRARNIYNPDQSDNYEDVEPESIFEGGLEEAVAHLTSRPASIIRLKDRGLIKEGYCADLVLFHPGLIRDVATFSNPKQPASGIRFVMVNGEFAVDEGGRQGPGMVEQFVTGRVMSLNNASNLRRA